MSKEDEIMNYLEEHVFEPILSSGTASTKLKQGARLTRLRMGKLRAESIVSYYWSAIVGTERSIGFSKQMKDEGFVRFEEIIEEFREKFDDNWLRS